MGHFASVLAAALAAFFVVLGITPLVERWALGRGLVDRPGGRHLHARAVPRLGSIALLAGWVAGGAVLWATGIPLEILARVLGGTVLVWLVGVYDDVRGLSPRAKLVGQLAAAAVAVWAGLRIEFVSIPSFLALQAPIAHLGQWAVPVTVLWLVGVSNAVNLLDGLDGLAAGVVAIAAIPTIVAAEATGLPEAAALMAVLAAGCVAFLRYNFSPARIFMGDGGALALGFAFAAVSALGTAKGPAAMALLVPVMSLGVPLFDTAWAVVRRSLAGRPVASADNGHVHYRLLARWRVPSQVVLALYAASAALGALGLLFSPQKRASLLPALVLAAVAVLLAARVAWDRFGWEQQHSHPGDGEGVEDGRGRDARLRHPSRSHQAGPRYQGP